MKKVFIITLLFLLCLVPLFAVEAFYKQLPAMFLVNLDDTFYKSHSAYATWADGSATKDSADSYYYDNQIIAVLGVNSATEDVTFTFELSGGNWLYLIDSQDKTISRPFGIDLIVKGRKKNSDDETYIDQGNGYVVHLGLQGDDVVSSNENFTYTIKKADLDKYKNIVWFDVCLVLPKLDENGSVTINGTTYTAKTTDKTYTSEIKVTVKSGTSLDKSYVIDLTGTYNSESSSGTDTGLKAMINIEPTTSATSLNLQGIGTNIINVASYSFMSESKYVNDIDYEESKAYIFLSSSSSQTTADGKFKLRRVRDNGSYSDTDNQYNSITFIAILSSKDGSNSVSFDGTTTYSTSKTGSYFAIDPEETTSQNTNKFVRWYSNGYIQIQLSPEGSEDATLLTAGKYTETIYIHVVSPE